MSNIKLEAMKEKIKDILEKHYFGRNRIEEKCANELLDLYNVSNRRELLIDFNELNSKKYYWYMPLDEIAIDEYISNL